MTDLHVRVWGDGEPVVLVHGSMSTGRTTWEQQRPLADRGYHLLVPDRRGYGQSPDVEGEDFEVDAADVIDLLEDGTHLVGHSYGALAGLLAAARRPEPVRSLAVVEPPAFSVASNDEAVRAFLADHQALWAEAHDLDDREFMERFIAMMGTDPASLPDPLLDMWTRRTRPMRLGRPAWDAEVPLDALREADLPILVVSGDHEPAFERICDVLEDELDARREAIAGMGHEVQRTGEPFNESLLRFWRSPDEPR